MWEQELDAVHRGIELAMLDLVGEHTKGERASAAQSLFRSLAVDEDAGQIDDLCNPATVFLGFEIDREHHGSSG